MAAIGKVFIEAVIICIGNGANGKSTLWNVINRVMGTYGGTISADVLTQNCKRNPKPELADLRGVRLALASELEEGATLSTSMLKQLASTDKITAERKYKAPFTFTPSHTTVLLTNYLPEIPSGVHSKGTWRRLIVVPFNAQIEPGQDVKNYADILFEQSGEAILSWIIESAQKIIAYDNLIFIHNNLIYNLTNLLCETLIFYPIYLIRLFPFQVYQFSRRLHFIFFFNRRHYITKKTARFDIGAHYII